MRDDRIPSARLQIGHDSDGALPPVKQSADAAIAAA
jgi:hypothetical protein